VLNQLLQAVRRDDVVGEKTE